ncbi:MAG: hypothetical protein AMXMBFR47_08360 [Planctomycetota bacterium]
MPDINHLVEVLDRYDAIRYDKSPWPDVGPDEGVVTLDWNRLFPRSPEQAERSEEWIPALEDFPADYLHALHADTVAPRGRGRQRRFPQLEPSDVPEGGILRPDLCAWYQPVHYFGPEMGIMIRQNCVLALAGRMRRYFAQQEFKFAEQELQLRLIRAAVLLYFLHEQYHHKVECFALRSNVVLREVVYHRYMDGVYANLRGSDDLLEESLAHADMYRRLGERAYSSDLGAPIVRAVRGFLKAIFPYEPPGYRRARDYLQQVDFDRGENRLQGQVREGRLEPEQPVDEWDEAPRLLQSIYDIRSQVCVVLRPGERLFLPGRVIPASCSTRDMVKLCSQAGYEQVRGAGKGSHVKLKKPGSRTIVLPGDRRDLSPGVISHALKILGGYSVADLPMLVSGKIKVESPPVGAAK